MKPSPRVEQYTLPASDAELDALIAIPALPVVLDGLDAEDASKTLETALLAMFLPDRQTRAVLRRLVSIARAHARAHMNTDEKYLAGLYAKDPWGSSRSPAICLTGPAGVGKTKILSALARALPGGSYFSVEGHTNIPLVSAWGMTLAKGDGLNELLRAHVEPPGSDTSRGKDWKIPDLLKAAQRVSWRGACCLEFVDEFQWISAGASSSARASSVLLKLHSIGSVLVFGANYSLGHKLKSGRPNEDRDRLLARPIVVLPLEQDDPDWTAYLSAVVAVASGVLVFNPVTAGADIHRYTRGHKRKVVDLVVIALRIARTQSARGTVGTDELLAAYRSAEFSMHRDDVEALHRQELTGKIERNDLVCPFSSTELEETSVTPANVAIESFERRVEEAHLQDAMTPTEAKSFKAIVSGAEGPARPGKVLRFKRQKVTKESLLAAAAALDGLE